MRSRGGAHRNRRTGSVVTAGLAALIVAVLAACSDAPPPSASGGATPDDETAHTVDDGPPLTAPPSADEIVPPASRDVEFSEEPEEEAPDWVSLNAQARLHGWLGAIQFPAGSAEISAEQAELLADYAWFIDHQAQLTFAVDGHVDPRDEGAVAMALARQRAEAVAETLQAWGIPERNIKVHAFGAQRPSCTERSAACRQANARVELSVLKSKQENRYRWQSWAEEADSRDEVSQLTVGDGYSVFFDLSALSYKDVLKRLGRDAPVVVRESSDVLDQEVQTLLAEREPGEEGTLSILVQPILVGEGLRYAADNPDPGQARIVDIDLARLSRQYLPAARVESVRELAALASALRAEDSAWNPVRVPVIATGDGCAGVALSIWSRTPPRPLDYIFHPVAIGDATCPDPMPDPTDLSQRLLGLYGAGQDLADAALHIFEMGLGTEPYTVGVFHDASAEDKAFHAWELAGTISDYVSKNSGLANAVKRARRGDPSYDFGVVSRSLMRALFSGKDDRDIEAATRAQQAFERFAARDAPRFFARLVNRQGESVFLPFGLLELGQEEPFRTKATIVQPLFEDDFGPKPCIASWTSAVPENAEDLVDSTEAELAPVGDLFPARLGQWSALEDYLLPLDKRPTPEGLLILAHHGEGALWFDAENLGTLDYSAVNRRFQPGSVAVLAACSVGKLDHLAMAERLQSRGIDAMILAPVDVTLPMAARFAMHFSDRVAEAVQQGEPRSLRELFNATLSSLKMDTEIEDADAAYEFLLAGDGEIQLCADGWEGAPGS